MKKTISLLIFLSAHVFGSCDIPTALSILTPGAAWTINGSTYTNLTWNDGVQTKPTQAQIDAQIALCLVAARIELSTTTASLIGNTTNYIGASAIGQVQTSAKLARILELRAMLGLP